MSLAAYLKSIGKTQAQMARDLGLRSKGYLSHIANGREDCPLKLALKIEDLTQGNVTALSLVDAADAELLRRFAARFALASGADILDIATPGGRA